MNVTLSCRMTNKRIKYNTFNASHCDEGVKLLLCALCIVYVLSFLVNELPASSMGFSFFVIRCLKATVA